MPLRLLKADRLIRNANVIVPVGFGLVIAAAIAVAMMLSRAEEADDWVIHSFEVRQATQSLLIDVRDAETAVREYLLFGSPDYLESFNRTRKRSLGGLERIQELVSDNEQQALRVGQLDPDVRAKLDEMNKALAVARDGQGDAARAIINSRDSRDLMGKIRDQISAILTSERSLLETRQDQASTQRFLLGVLIGLTLLAALVLAGLLALSTRHAVQGLMQRTRELEEESKLRQEAEATLAQAIKMEAVGQLTGGIAHDFNNLLTIITGNLDSMKRQLANLASAVDLGKLRDKLMKSLDSALQGANSAAQLTQRLLAFSRRQALEPVRLDMNKLVSGMLDMLRRTLGEQISVETVLAAGLWPTYADAHQLENALLNLALNAKAAMPEGGCLTIETANTYLDDAYVRRFGDVEAGQYAVLCVTDTGTGIPKDVLDRVFEPFFTTKGHGEGSGLGLAMVHGFVKQSGGHIRVYSEEGEGTTVKIYLPRLTETEEVRAAPAGKAFDASDAPSARGYETVLLVEDNGGVRDYAKDVLESLGYAVIEAADADEALRVIRARPPLTLLFTDVVLPGTMSGRDLAAKVREKYPNLPVLYTTGYTRNAIVHQGRLDPDVHLLNKPYTQQDLARKLRELIDAGAR